ncbi:maleylpyruvate isomerase family mycothiol-dependent enzyme [Nocardioides litoris]|uniref:maleylpyruvate isomerase family mycothiol-dependent enzyme n=1 Tax=Nocardioides litoris TaxID=1926648 RepID=UPI00111E3DDC|nr:maleylpyruvate isomerase family mycothiol-dependent enzyme [Nocardioides litoris]
MDLTGALETATGRLLTTVDGLDDAAWAGPSLLPGWSRAHVVAHLALNAEALAAVVAGAAAGEAVPMYPSQEARDGDVAALAGEGGPAAAVRLRAGGAALEASFAVVAGLPVRDRAAVEARTAERTPGSDRTFAVGEVARMRLGEVEVHHADLDAGYAAADWPLPFALDLVHRLAPRVRATLRATDDPAGTTWQGGPGAPTVTGTAASLGWWLSGRGTGEGLTSDGELPGIEAW